MEKIFFQHCASLLTDMRRLGKDALLTDVELVCTGGKKVYTNSMLLFSASPLLRSYSPFSRVLSCSESEDHCILLPDFCAEHVQTFLDKLLVWNVQPSIHETEILRKIGSTFGVKSVIISSDMDKSQDPFSSSKDEAQLMMSSVKRRKLPLRTIYQCDKCQKQFHLKRNFMHHINSHLGIKPYSCGLCEKRFSQKSHLNTHLKIHTGAKPYICHKCGKAFSVSSNLKKHASIHCRDQDDAEPPSSACEDAGRDIQTLDTENTEPLMLEPDNLLVEQEPYQSMCKEDLYVVQDSFHSPDAEVDDAEAPEPCQQQQRVEGFQSSTDLDHHIDNHHLSKKHRCELCQKDFTQKSHLNQHKRVKHSDGEYLRRYECDICKRRLTSNHSLKKHKMLHWNDKPFVCEMCDKSFVQKSHLETHRLKHVGVRPHLCVECGKSFFTRGHLKEHMKNHSGERKVYQCLECNAQYFGFHDLQIHMRRHSGEAPFSCPSCPKRFRSKRNLDNHMRIHTGEKPFKCLSCSKLFTTSSSLCQHFKKAPSCRGQLMDTTGAYSLKSKSNTKISDGGEQEMKSCIILDCLDLSIPTVSLSPLPEPQLQKSVSFASIAQEKNTSSNGGTESQVEPGITLPRIFLDN